jgi:antitoxin ParD1/3/4
MSTVQKISIALPPKMATNLKKAVEKGGYSSASEVVREALRDWEEKQVRKKEQLKRLRKMIQDGIDSGIGQYNSMDEIIAEARRRHQAKSKSAA